MKWLERRTTDRDDLETRLIERKFGLAGCTIWDRLQLIVAENMEGLKTDDWGFVAEDETMQSLANQIRCTLTEFREFVKFCDEMMILEKRNGRLFCKYVLDRMNEYARKIVKKEKSEKTEIPKNPRNIHNTTPHITTQLPNKILPADKPQDIPKKRSPIQERNDRICSFLEKTLDTKITNYEKQMKALQMIFKAGYTEEQVCKTITYMATKDEFYIDKGFDLMTVMNQLPIYKAKFRKPERQVN